ncbi:MAG: hypothetical protein KC619_33520 [Myxococcales bacterium]|nr:hypothetical protein [Myxococcales bacterium]
MTLVVRIVVDHRERRSAVYAVLEEAADIDVQLAPLKLGDYLVDDRVLVERKTFGDFVASILRGRMFDQAARLARARLPAVVLLEGAPPRHPRLGRAQIQGAIVTLTFVFDLPLLRSRGPDETVWLLRALGRQAARRQARGAASRSWNPKDADARRIHMLTALPGVGPKRAAALLTRFGSLRAVVDATEPEIAAVPGIGPHTAVRIRQFVCAIAEPGRRSRPDP